MRTHSIRKIGIVLFGILGDVLTRTPTVREIRRLFPGAHIECFVDPIGFEALQNSPDIDSFKVVIRSRRDRLRYLESKIYIFLYLVTHRFDLFIDLYGNSTSNLMSLLAHSKKRIVVANGTVEARGLDAKYDRINFVNPHHLSNASLEILRFFPLDTVSLDTRPVIDSDFQGMKLTEKKYIDDFIKLRGSFFLLSAGSGDAKKVITPAICADTARAVSQRKGPVPVLLFNPGAKDVQKEIAQEFDREGILYYKFPPLSVPAVAYLIKRSAFVVVSDSGILHLTVALEIPFFGVFTYTPPEEVVPSNGIFETCFKPDPAGKAYGSRGLVYGDRELTRADLLPKLEKFLDRIGVGTQ